VAILNYVLSTGEEELGGAGCVVEKEEELVRRDRTREYRA
jgi:hypothetical protein